MAFHKSNNPSFAKQGFSPTDHLRGFHLHINWKPLGVKKYLYVSNCSCSHAVARCRELSSHSPALRGETTSWLQTSSDEKLGHLGSVSWTEVEPYAAPHWKEQCACFCVAKDDLLGVLLPLSLQQRVSFSLPACG